MKKQHIVISFALALFVAFGIAGYFYKAHRADKLESMAKTPDSPLARAHAVSMGPEDAKVIIVEFFDPGCETCRVFAAHVKTLLADYPGKVRLVLRYAPFHQGADTMVQILEAARLQGKYWPTLKVMYDSQPVWASHHAPKPEKIWQFLPVVGLDMDKLRTDMKSPKILALIQQDIQDAKTLSVRKTPSFFVNGKPLPRFGFQQLRTLVGSEVAAKYGN